MKWFVYLTVAIKIATALHCWEEKEDCGDPKSMHYDSNCDTAENRVQDLSMYKECLYSFCQDMSLLQFRVRSQDGNTNKPSGVVCANEAYKPHAPIFNRILAGCIKQRYQGAKDNIQILCCQRKMTSGCK